MHAFRLAYDGRPFHGFQRQPDVPTVENALFDALGALGVTDGGAPSGYAAAGRTDAGASALAQTVAFGCPDWLSPRALNAELPDAIRAWASADVPGDFHATHDARRREYVYHLYAPGADTGRAREAAARLAGRHDFHNLTPDDADTVRDLSLSVDPDGGYLVLRAGAGGFDRQLVRRLASLVRAVACGDAPIDKVERVLGSDPVAGPEGVPPAPALPLVLVAVAYDGVDFDPDADAAADARSAFETRRVEGATLARVAAEIADGVALSDSRN